MGCTVQLADIVLDDTVDGHGQKWTWRALRGWFDGADVDLPVMPRSGRAGVIAGRGYLRGRSLTLEGTCRVQAPYVDNWQLAVERLQGAVLEDADTTLAVLEYHPKQSAVRLTGPLQVSQAAQSRYLVFQVPMLAADPRKYGTTLHDLNPAPSPIVNAGNYRTPVEVHVTGYASGLVTVTNATDSGRSFTVDTGSATAEIVADTATGRVTVGGTPADSAVTGLFFDLIPGNNAVTASSGTLRVVYRDGWR